MPDFSNLREGQVPPTFDHVAIVDGDRVEQPGTLYRDSRWFEQNIEREKRQMWTPTQDRAADKYGNVTVTAGTTFAVQLLPADQDRKDAVIYCMNNPIYLGDETSVGNVLGQALATATLTPGVLPLLQSNLSTLFSLRYTAKQGLYVCSAGAAGTVANVYCFVEKFNSGTPVR